MCLAVALPPLNELEYEIPSIDIKRAWCYNSHGAGFSYLENGKVVIKKGFMKQSKLMRAFYKARRDFPNSSFTLHLRRKSVGEVSAENTHPFTVINDKMSMIHNGTIYKIDTEKGQTDSEAFANMVAGLPDGFLKHDGYGALLSHYIGDSKVVFLTDENKIYIVNQNKGVVDSDIWYSNDYFKDDRFDKYVSKDSCDGYCKCGNELIFDNEISTGECFSCQYDVEEETGNGKCRWCGEAIDESSPDETKTGFCASCLAYIKEQEELEEEAQYSYLD